MDVDADPDAAPSRAFSAAAAAKAADTAASPAVELAPMAGATEAAPAAEAPPPAVIHAGILFAPRPIPASGRPADTETARSVTMDVHVCITFAKAKRARELTWWEAKAGIQSNWYLG